MNYQDSISAESLGAYGLDGVEVKGEARTRRNRWIIAGALLFLAILAATWYLAKSGDAGTAAAGNDNSQAPSISVITPGRATIEGTITATGTLGARREIPVGVVGEGGRVVSVPVEQGQWVRAGQVLVSIDRSVQNQQARAQAAQVEVSRADAQLAQSNLDRALLLIERGFISKADVDRLTATRDAARARVEVAQAQYNELVARNARLDIVAPVAGLVLERNVEPGQTVSAGGTPLFLIAKGGEMELKARVGETELARLAPGVSARIIPSGSGQIFTGQVWQIEPTIDPLDRQGVVRIALAYAVGLRPGGFATATISSGTLVAPILPESAIMSDDAGSFVYIVDGKNKARRRAVTTGAATSSGIAISKGLDGSEQVVLRAGGFLTDGETIVPEQVKPQDVRPMGAAS